MSVRTEDDSVAELEMEFGYCSEEESVFQSFSQDVERVMPRIKKSYSTKDDTKNNKIQIKDMLKRVRSRPQYVIVHGAVADVRVPDKVQGGNGELPGEFECVFSEWDAAGHD